MPQHEQPPPAPPAGPRALTWGRVLVALQFGLIAWLVGLGAAALRLSPVGPGLVVAAVLAVGGAVLGLAALAANRPGNFNIHPAPRDGGHLVAHGPYRWIRHPMYAAVLLMAAAAAVVAAGVTAALAWLALLAVLLAKAQLEERWLASHHAGYAAYCRHTRRLLPGVY